MGAKYYVYNDLSTYGSTIDKTYLDSDPSPEGSLEQVLSFTEVKNEEKVTIIFGQNGGAQFDCQYSHRSSSNNIKVFGQHVVYPTVSEVAVDANGDINGFVVHDFYTGRTATTAPYITVSPRIGM